MPSKEVNELLELIFSQAKMQFGSAIKSRWLHDGEGCPGCGRKVKAMKYKGNEALSLNAFIFREHGVLIAYMLCGRCARYILTEADKNPLGGQTELHGVIEKNLKQAFLKHLGH